MNTRVVITGLGVVSCAGSDRESLTDAVADARSSLSAIDDPRVSHFRATHAGIIHDDIPGQPDRHVVLALRAARQAMASSGLQERKDSRVLGVVHATCSGPMRTIEEQYAAALDGNTTLSENDCRARRYDSGAYALAAEFGATGPVLTVTTACSASTVAVAVACDLLRAGLMDIALVGGADAFSLTTLAGFDALRATAPGPCAPFSNPIGMCLGEAGAYGILERLDNAVGRHASILAEVLGVGTSNDAYHCSSPDPSGRGSALAMTRALEHAGLGSEDIAYVNAHGTGTESNDKSESRAVVVALGEVGSRVPTSSIKGVSGHCLGAAGMLEIAATLGCAERGVLPPTAGYHSPREGCTLDYVSEAGRRWEGPATFMSNNLAFGGNNASVVLTAGGTHDGDSPQRPRRDVCICACELVSTREPDPQALRDAGLAPELISDPLVAPSLDLRAVDRRIDARGMDAATVMGAAAAARSLACVGLRGRRATRAGVGLYMQCAHAPVWAESDHVTAILGSGFHTDSLAAFPFVVPNSVCGGVARALSLTGQNATFCLGEGGAVAGMAIAAAAIESSRAELLLSVTADESPKGALGEPLRRHMGGDDGATSFLLCESEAARARGHYPVAWLRGYAVLSDSAGTAAGMDRAARAALDRAGIEGSDIWKVLGDTRTEELCSVVNALGVPDSCPILDFGDRIGRPGCCGPALTLALVLKALPIEARRQTKYILTLLGTSAGTAAALVLQLSAEQD